MYNESLIKYPLRKATLQFILPAGLLVGTLDILSAFTDYAVTTGKNPLVVLNYVASGALGEAALSGGAGIRIAGLLFHYLIAFSFTVFFFWMYRRVSFLSANRLVTGILYGVFIWVIMNLVVVQLSAAPHSPVSGMKLTRVAKSMGILIVMIGLPLSFIAYRYFIGQTLIIADKPDASRRQGSS